MSEDLNNEKNDFISTVSHELRTPLTSIRGFAQTMLTSWDKLDDESKKKFIAIIEQQSNRLINLVENVLSVTKNHNLILKSINANSQIDIVVQLVKHKYADCPVELKLNKKIPNILVDAEKFQQIMMNLIENAAKYKDKESTITVETDFIDEDVSVKVINKGIGIDKSNYDKIFEKFSRVDSPLTRKVQGSGLGLFITKTLVEKMNGKISVESENGVTTFSVVLPSDNIETLARAKCSVQH